MSQEIEARGTGTIDIHNTNVYCRFGNHQKQKPEFAKMWRLCRIWRSKASGQDRAPGGELPPRLVENSRECMEIWSSEGFWLKAPDVQISNGREVSVASCFAPVGSAFVL